ncbi:hypothetical protein B0H19DRAFT_1122418 [Mycena capillaripes]|nr:hypothetical protein B0H19DRAFT_1122418 [Mycena capillaripes]
MIPERPMHSRLYLDDTLIVINHADSLTQREAYQYLIIGVLELIHDDWDNYRHKLEHISYLRASRAAEDCFLPLFADVIKEFEAVFRAKRKQIGHGNDSLYAPSSATVPCLSVKPIPYSEKVVLPPLILPPKRQGPKTKTKGITALIEFPVPVAADPIPSRTPRSVPNDVYNSLERIFSPLKKGKVSFSDLKRVMTCKEIGFSYEPGSGSRRRFLPPLGSGLTPYTFHAPHGGGEIHSKNLRKALTKLYGWTLESFARKAKS